jgi:hypothetical protein
MLGIQIGASLAGCYRCTARDECNWAIAALVAVAVIARRRSGCHADLVVGVKRSAGDSWD